MYSDQVRRLLRELPNRGASANATHSGRAENPVCCDVIELQLEIRKGRIVECCFKAYGCPGAVAAAAGLTELVEMKQLDFCIEMSVAELLQYLGGLPKQKQHGVDLALTALRNALEAHPSET
jgi:NifU-like protein involved in Fe-S cluster formation